MAMEIFRDLPKELVEEEILTHVPARNLKGLGSTCKRWNRLFNGDRRFARKHSDKAGKQFVVLMLTRDYRICPTIVDLDGKVPSLEVKSELSLVDPKYPAAQFGVDLASHCDGLLLCSAADESRFVVWNPFTGETRWFQPRYGGKKTRFFVLGYGKDKSYKVLSFYCFGKDFEIYEFSSDTWRVVDEIIAPGRRLGYSGINVSLKGSTYWFGLDETKTQTRAVSLVKFDYSREKFVPVSLPYESKGFEVASLSVVKDEKLSVLLQRELTSKTEVWVSNKVDENGTSPVVSWSMVLALDLSSDLQVFDGSAFLLDEEKKVVMITVNLINLDDETDPSSKDMVCIVGEDNQVTEVDFGLGEEADGCQAAILNYVPSLVQIERPGGKRERGE